MQESSTTSNRSALVATFSSREAAHQAASRLHEEGFNRTWIGITRAMEEAYSAPANAGAGMRVESENALARFFGTGDESLHEALLQHGVSESDAARIDGTLPADSAILTVDGANHPELAAQVVAECGGSMVASAGAGALYDHYAEGRSSGLSSDRLATLGDYAKGEKLDEPRRLQLREERLSIDKHREKTGEVTIGKNVVSEKTEVDVPVMHEELYIERRPASGAYATDAGTIGDGETIRVPLEREVVDAQKRTVVTEEVAVGQRRVDGVEHVSETLRKEVLDVDDKSGRSV